jgi:hypothetical protein
MCKANRALIVSMTPPRTTRSQMISPRSGLGGAGHLTARDDGLDQLDGRSRISDYCSFDAGDVEMAC